MSAYFEYMGLVPQTERPLPPAEQARIRRRQAELLEAMAEERRAERRASFGDQADDRPAAFAPPPEVAEPAEPFFSLSFTPEEVAKLRALDTGDGPAPRHAASPPARLVALSAPPAETIDGEPPLTQAERESLLGAIGLRGLALRGAPEAPAPADREPPRSPHAGLTRAEMDAILKTSALGRSALEDRERRERAEAEAERRRRSKDLASLGWSG